MKSILGNPYTKGCLPHSVDNKSSIHKGVTTMCNYIFCVYDNGKQAKYDVIHLQINQPLFSIELSAFIQEQGIIERNRGDYDISKSMIYICLRKGQ